MAEPIVVIAYRNPVEQMIWENIGPISAFFAICLVVIFAAQYLIYLISSDRFFSNHAHKISIPLGFIVAFAYLWFF
jgi:hypothetical protein